MVRTRVSFDEYDAECIAFLAEHFDNHDEFVKIEDFPRFSELGRDRVLKTITRFKRFNLITFLDRSSIEILTGVLSVANQLSELEDENEPHETVETPEMLKLFVSHSSRDSRIIEPLIALLHSALHLRASQIRCSSVDGYRLPAGANIEDQLRAEVYEAKAFIGVISSNSLESMYVTFELGARWGAGKHFVPLLAPGADASILSGPLAGINALRLDDTAQLHQLIGDLAGELETTPESAAVYQSHIEAFLKIAAAHQSDVEENSNPVLAMDSDNKPDGSLPMEQQDASRRDITLDDMQIDYLLEISKPRNDGSISGVIDEQTGRDVAPYQEAIKLFLDYDLMRYGAGEYVFTPDGWKLADQLWALRILDALEFDKITDSTDVAEAVGLTDGQTELDELKRHVQALEGNHWVKVIRGLDGFCVRIVEEGVTQRKHRRIQ